MPKLSVKSNGDEPVGFTVEYYANMDYSQPFRLSFPTRRVSEGSDVLFA